MDTSGSPDSTTRPSGHRSVLKVNSASVSATVVMTLHDEESTRRRCVVDSRETSKNATQNHDQTARVNAFS